MKVEKDTAAIATKVKKNYKSKPFNLLVNFQYKKKIKHIQAYVRTGLVAKLNGKMEHLASIICLILI